MWSIFLKTWTALNRAKVSLLGDLREPKMTRGRQIRSSGQALTLCYKFLSGVMVAMLRKHTFKSPIFSHFFSLSNSSVCVCVCVSFFPFSLCISVSLFLSLHLCLYPFLSFLSLFHFFLVLPPSQHIYTHRTQVPWIRCAQAVTPCIDLLPNCNSLDMVAAPGHSKIPCFDLLSPPLAPAGSVLLSPLTSFPSTPLFQHRDMRRMRESTLVLTPEQITSAVLSADLKGIFLSSVDRIINYFLKDCSLFLSCSSCTLFFKPWNDELALQVRVVPQIKHSVALVLFLCWDIWSCVVHNKKEVGNTWSLCCPLPWCLSVSALDYETHCLLERNEVNSTKLALPKLISMSMYMSALCGQVF